MDGGDGDDEGEAMIAFQDMRGQVWTLVKRQDLKSFDDMGVELDEEDEDEEDGDGELPPALSYEEMRMKRKKQKDKTLSMDYDEIKGYQMKTETNGQTAQLRAPKQHVSKNGVHGDLNMIQDDEDDEQDQSSNERS